MELGCMQDGCPSIGDAPFSISLCQGNVGSPTRAQRRELRNGCNA